MTSLHFGTFVWLRWRLFINQLRRGGIASGIILGMLAVSACLGSIAAFVGAVAAGVFLLPMASTTVQLMIWDGLVLAFLFSWSIGLLNELQRSEALTFEKFLHLPVSLGGVFVLNYLSSFVSVTLLFMLPILFGLALGSVIGVGPAMIVQLPLVAAFIFAATALTYQFQGWLASLMVDKRRRRTIIVVITLTFVLTCQLPNLINIFRPWESAETESATKEKEALLQNLKDQKITHVDYQKKIAEVDRKTRKESVEQRDRLWKTFEESAWYANVLLPPGWLALGGATAADGNIIPALLGALAYALIGTASLWRAYRTVLRLYTGEFTANKQAPSQAPAVVAPTSDAPKNTFLDKTVPWLPEQAAVVALATLRGLLRAPETKMVLLSPIIMLAIFGGLFWRGGMQHTPRAVMPLVASGAILLILFSIAQLAGNQFGYDRAGFRIFVLSPAPRRDILLGKNLALAPIVFTMLTPLVIALQCFMWLRIDQFLALPLQFLCMFLVYCMVANVISILTPMPVAAGSLKPAQPKGFAILTHVAFALLMPMFLSPTLLPQGVEAALEGLGVTEGWPIALVLTMVECAAVIAIYRVVLDWQGRWLESRELKILDAVTTKAE